MLNKKIKIEIEIRKKHIAIVLFVLFGISMVYAYMSNSPTTNGHSVGEIDFSSGLSDNVKNQLIGEKGDKGARGVQGDPTRANCVIEFGASTTLTFTSRGQWRDCPQNYAVTKVYFYYYTDSYVKSLECRELKLRCS